MQKFKFKLIGERKKTFKANNESLNLIYFGHKPLPIPCTQCQRKQSVKN